MSYQTWSSKNDAQILIQFNLCNFVLKIVLNKKIKTIKGNLEEICFANLIFNLKDK